MRLLRRLAMAGTLLVVLVPLVWGCNVVVIKPVAEDLVSRHFASRVPGALAETLSLYGDEFFELMPEAEWSVLIKLMELRLGAVEHYSPTGWHVYVGMGSAGTGTYTTLDYEVLYEHSPAEETFLVFRPPFGPSRILGHVVTSEALAGF